MKYTKILNFILIMTLVASVLATPVAQAATKKHNPSYSSKKHAALVVDASTGNILQEENSDSKRYPASLTKMMTLYLTFEALKHGQLGSSDYLYVSKFAASQPSLTLGLRAGDRVKVSDLIKSIAVVSANDAAVVLAEKLGKNERGFSLIMNKRAHQLGMSDTTFVNASGLHNPRQKTTAKDMAKLLIAIKRDYPEYYNVMALESFYYKGKKFQTHNRIMKKYTWAKAGKTGYVNASGFNLALNAQKNGKDIVGVVMGGRSAQSRDSYMKKILDKGFAILTKRAGLDSRYYISNAAENW